MAKFAEIYPDREFVQQVVTQIPWGHNIVLLKLVGKVVAAPFCLMEELRNRLAMFIVS